MTLSAILLQVSRQFTRNWLRLLLASLGILIGVWSLAVTTSLSLSAASTIVTAVNSQDAAREFTLTRTVDNTDSLAEFTGGNRQALSLAEVDSLVAEYDDFESAYPLVSSSAYLRDLENPVFCGGELYTLSKNLQGEAEFSFAEATAARERISANCQPVALEFAPLDTLDADTGTLVGAATLEPGQVAVCYRCDPNNPLSEQLGATTPSDLLGRTLTLELAAAPDAYRPGEVEQFETDAADEAPAERLITLEIASVLDDRDVETNVFAGTGQARFYLPLESYPTLLETPMPLADLGFFQYAARTDSFENLTPLLDELNATDYTAESGTATLIQGVTNFFYGVAGVLGLFGIIALVASMFGIINVMTVSVLRRQREIGILKALGARGRDIFRIFMLESALLGFLGWLVGLLATYLTLLAVRVAFDQYVLTNTDWVDSLERLNLTEFAPSIPWYIALLTLVAALLFTGVSGLVPSIRAARKNPVDVLR